MKAVIYARVSTDDQDTERQVYELMEFAKKEGYDDVRFFGENITGKKDAKTRKEFDAMLDYIKENNINQIYSWELSRLGRTVRDISANVHFFRTEGINLYIKKENINTRNNDANTQFQLNILASMAEFELETIKSRTISGTYNSIRKGGAGGGSIKQFGYKKVAGKLLVDNDEAAVILDICDRYLNGNWSVKQIADYLNDLGIHTRYKKLIDEGIITYKLASDLLWTDGSVARLLHKRLLTGYRKYGKVELQDEKLRIISNEIFEALQVKMELKRTSKANSQKYEHILRGTLRCEHCGSSLVMSKGKSGLQNHYQCYRRFTLKDKSCKASMINIDLLNNLVYRKSKDFEVTSADVEKRINEFKSAIYKNTISTNQLNVELNAIEKQESNLVDLYIKELVKLPAYEAKLKSLNDRTTEIRNAISEFAALNISLNNQIKALESKKLVDLSNPEIFKANIKELIESITVGTLNDEDLIELNSKLSDLYEKTDNYIIRHKGREKIYRVVIRMFDHNTIYECITKNTENYGDAIKVELINPKDKNKDLFTTKRSKPKDKSFSL
jgi:site-specific DNA recombinase